MNQQERLRYPYCTRHLRRRTGTPTPGSTLGSSPPLLHASTLSLIPLLTLTPTRDRRHKRTQDRHDAPPFRHAVHVATTTAPAPITPTTRSAQIRVPTCHDASPTKIKCTPVVRSVPVCIRIFASFASLPPLVGASQYMHVSTLS